MPAHGRNGCKRDREGHLLLGGLQGVWGAGVSQMDSPDTASVRWDREPAEAVGDGEERQRHGALEETSHNSSLACWLAGEPPAVVMVWWTAQVEMAERC
jgi:hypothetical protein